MISILPYLFLSSWKKSKLFFVIASDNHLIKQRKKGVLLNAGIEQIPVRPQYIFFLSFGNNAQNSLKIHQRLIIIVKVKMSGKTQSLCFIHHTQNVFVGQPVFTDIFPQRNGASRMLFRPGCNARSFQMKSFSSQISSCGSRLFFVSFLVTT